MILSVALDIPVDKTFDYELPSGMEDDSHSFPGRRVKIPFGPREILGVVVAVAESSEFTGRPIKPISKIIDDEPLLSTSLLKLARWMADRYVCSMGESLFSLLPPGSVRRSVQDDDRYETFDPETVGDLSRPFEWTDEQKAAIEKIRDSIFSTAEQKKSPKKFLLFGVAAAGKTEVYAAAIKDVLSQGKSVLYLAPEIGLAEQSAKLLKNIFGDSKVELWTSHLTEAHRRDIWWKSRKGEVQILVGTRSAALLPLADLGLIVVDEEHDSFYKEEQKPRFHAREVALMRGTIENAVVILGSATPSLESYQSSLDGEIELLTMSERAVAASKPRIHLIDLNTEKKFGSLSEPLKKAVGERLQKHERCVLFLNKRGFHRYVMCPDCHWVARCARCQIPQVLHKEEKKDAYVAPVPLRKKTVKKSIPAGTLVCHQCNQTDSVPMVCPQCHKNNLVSGGAGTARVEDEIKRDFPWARVARWDFDNIKKNKEHSALFQEIIDGKIDILIGTQLVAQGFNFPQVTLVAILDADSSLLSVDFRGGEHAYQQLAQVAGRAGRELVTGDVYIQTRHPEHYALKSVAQLSTLSFLKEELVFRHDLFYPPFADLIRIVSESKKADSALKEISEILEWLEKENELSDVQVLGPIKTKTPRKVEAFQILLKIKKDKYFDLSKRLKQHIGSRLSKFKIYPNPETIR